jgi:hypothetical protein
MSDERLDRQWAWRQCDGEPEGGFTLDGDGRQSRCREPAVVVTWDQEDDAFSGWCEQHRPGGPRRRP